MDRREAPWKVLRVVVEAKVPPTSRATEKDLIYHLETIMPETVHLRRSIHADARPARLRFKAWGKWWPVFRIKLKREGQI